MLWIIPSTVSGIMDACECTLSRSFSDQPEPFSALRYKIIASLVPVDENGDDFSNIMEQKFLKMSGRSQISFPWQSAVVRGVEMFTVHLNWVHMVWDR